jgi:zeaxanthin glucosyltransferase
LATVGFIVPPVPGHVLPSIAQAQGLQARGHRARFYHLGDLRPQIEAAGIEFCALGETRLPAGSLQRMRAEVAGLRGLRASFRSVQQFLCTGEMFAAELPDALQREPVDLMMVDQVEPVGGLVARALKLPYVSVSNALPIMPDPGIPPPTTPWLPGGPFCELRNTLAYQILHLVFAPTFRLLRREERRHGLPKERALMPYESQQAQVAQLIAGFDFPRKNPEPLLQYVGSTRDASSKEIPFDWDWLDGRPLIYASLGTTVCRQLPTLRAIALAAKDLDAQMVLSLGGQGEPAELGRIPENVRVLSFAPQPELIARANLVITHAGMNTTMESLHYGKPMLAMPISYEQPGIAARIYHSGCGLRLGLRASRSKIRGAIGRLLSDPSFAESAKKLQSENARAGGAERVAEIAESLIEGQG